MGQHTHRIRPKAPGAKWQHVTEQELAAITKQFGERHIKSAYQVEPMTEKPAALPTAEAPKGRGRLNPENPETPATAQ